MLLGWGICGKEGELLRAGVFGSGGVYLVGLKVECSFAAMNKPQAKDKLIPVRDFAASYIGRRGFPVSVQYIYKLIAANKKGKDITFEYKEIGKQIWILK